MKRRSFLRAAGVTGGFALGICKLRAALSAPARAVPRRALGRTGASVPVVGFPGFGLIHDEQPACTAALHAAIDMGLDYLDVAPAYRDAEAKMGVGLRGIRRERYFLACKTKMRDATAARQELERSLQTLGTDHFDLYQLHHLRTEEEVAQALAPGGAMEALARAREEGKIRWIGFSAHTTRAALAAMRGARFDTVMFPINFVEQMRYGFGSEVIALAKEQGAAVLAIKALSLGLWPKNAERTRKWWYRSAETDREIDLALRYALGLDNVAAAFPPAWIDLFQKAVTIAPDLRPLTPQETEELRRIAAERTPIFEGQQAVDLRDDAGECYPHHPFDRPAIGHA